MIIECSVFLSFMSSNKNYSIAELQTLLSKTEDEIHDTLMSSSHHHNAYYYENFTGISLRTLKYINHYLNRINHDQTLGTIIDNIIAALSRTLDDYKGRNIYEGNGLLSPFAQSIEDEHHQEEDEIYHFMNTRNSALPMECLPNAEMERQRSQLAEFVEKMERKKNIVIKEPKRSLILPKDNNFILKMARKATFDVSLTPIQEEDGLFKQGSAASLMQNRNSEDAETQTELLNAQIDEEDQQLRQIDGLLVEEKQKQQDKTIQPIPTEVVSQALTSLIPSRKENDEIKKSNRKLNQKKKGAKNGQSKNGKTKKKAKFNNSQKNLQIQLSKQGSINNLKKSEVQFQEVQRDKTPQSRMCSLRLMKSLPINLQLCFQQVDLRVQKAEQFNITINFSEGQKQKLIYKGYSFHQIKAQKEKSFQENVKDVTHLKVINQVQEHNRQLICKDQQRQTKIFKVINNVAVTQFESHNKSVIDQQSSTINVKSKKTNTLESSNSSKKLNMSSIKIIENLNDSAIKLSYNSQQSSPQNSPFNHIKSNPKRSTILGRQFIQQSSNQQKQQINNSLKGISQFRSSKIGIETPPMKVNIDKLQRQSQIQKMVDQNYQSDKMSEIPSCRTDDYLDSRITDSKQSLFRENKNLNDSQIIIKRIKKKLVNSTSVCHNSIQTPQQLPRNSQIQGLITFQSSSKAHHQSLLAKQNNEQVPLQNSKILQGIRKIKDQFSNSGPIKYNTLAAIIQKQKMEQSNMTSSLRTTQKEIRGGSVGHQPKKERLGTFLKKQIKQNSKSLTSNQQPRLLSSTTNTMHHKRFLKKGENESCPGSWGAQQWQQMNSQIRHRGRKQKMNQYLQLIEMAHRRFCGNKCIHIETLYKKMNSCGAVQDEDIETQLLKLLKKQN